MYYRSSIPASFQWTLNINLRDDLNTIVYNDLIKAGYTDAEKKHAVFLYYNLKKRQIDPRPRDILYSREFLCPDGYELALREFEEKVKNGDSLKPFQSEKIKKSTYNDLLLNDWNIQHFHLSRRYRDDGFVQRSQYQIFAFVTDKAVYMIQVYPHKEDDAYYKQEMVRILHDNWPDLLKPFHIEGAYCLIEKFDDTQYRAIREAKISTFVDLGPNEVYGMIGGGYASNGFSTEAVSSSDFLMNQLELFQQIIVDNAEWIAQSINQSRRNTASFCELDIRLLWIDYADKITTLEKNTALIVQIDKKENYIRICEPYEVFE